MRVYLDNVAASGRVVGDLEPPEEMKALREIEQAHSNRQLKIVTSRESWREQERTKDVGKRAKLEAARGEVSVVASDHRVLGFSDVNSPRGSTTVYPLITDIVDEALFIDLKSIGLLNSDARHLMYAFTNSCDRFLTLDPDFLDRRAALEARCPTIKIVTPSELAAELRIAQGPRTDG